MADGFEWGVASPEERGLDGARLDALRDDLAGRGTRGLLIIRHDRIVYEWYAPEHGPRKRHFTASLAKALVGGMSLLLALNDGLMEVDDPAWKYIPAWKDDPVRSRITIRELATHTAGLEDANIPGKGHFELGGWKEAFWRREPDPFTIALRDAPVLFTPGTEYAYSNPGMAALAYAVTTSLRGTPHEDIRSFLKNRILDPIGVPEGEWSIGYEEPSRVDGMELWGNWGGGGFTARAAARVGRLMMWHGEWQGRRIVDSAWVDRMLEDALMPGPDRSHGEPAPRSGLCWYVNKDKVWPAVPRDAFGGAGAQHQLMLVVPSLDLIVVRNGAVLADPGAPGGFWGPAERDLFTPLMEAVIDQPPATATENTPYPGSRFITNIHFAPAEEIVRKGVDSDNWPITWMDDGDQFVAYGDGWGFEPHTDKKLSLGFGRVKGDPPDFAGVNVRSESGETVGGGRNGLKASGLVMVDGVLYMWVRNADNAQIAWSEDHGETWEWGYKLRTSFGCPTFLNFGQNYAGARDEYVYTYSQDGPGAYEPYDGVVMARAHKDHLRERNALEFFAGLSVNGEPIWTADIDERQHVLGYLGRCQRMDAAFHEPTGRYLLVVGFNHRGGWGIFDGPEPWGPWSTAFHTIYWGLGSTHYYRLPTKWMSPDGKSMHLVFSGRTHGEVIYDAMCVREAEVHLGPGATGGR